MGVDGIGGPRGPFAPPGGGTPSAGAVAPNSGVRVQNESADAAQGVAPQGVAPQGVAPQGVEAGVAAGVGDVGGAGAAELERARLASGELTFDQYLELQIQHATSHLEGQAPASLLDEIRGVLREELTSDPVLASLASRVAAD